MEKRTISSEIYTACVGVMYIAQKHYAEAESARMALAGLLAEATARPDGISQAERKNEYADHISDAIYGSSSSDAVESIEGLLGKLDIEREIK